MNKFTKTVKSVVTGAAFAAFAMASTSASAEISIGDGVMESTSWATVQAFCGNSFINCTDIRYDNYRSVYVVTYTA